MYLSAIPPISTNGGLFVSCQAVASVRNSGLETILSMPNKSIRWLAYPGQTVLRRIYIPAPPYPSICLIIDSISLVSYVPSSFTFVGNAIKTNLHLAASSSVIVEPAKSKIFLVPNSLAVLLPTIPSPPIIHASSTISYPQKKVGLAHVQKCNPDYDIFLEIYSMLNYHYSEVVKLSCRLFLYGISFPKPLFLPLLPYPDHI